MTIKKQGIAPKTMGEIMLQEQLKITRLDELFYRLDRIEDCILEINNKIDRIELFVAAGPVGAALVALKEKP